jgi:DNA-binding transcriptional ArsR family regulator
MRAHNNTAGASDVSERSDEEQLAAAAEVMGHLAEPTRLHLLRLLAAGGQDVTTLTAQVSASRSSVSQHLGRLRLAGLVHADRDGRRMVYCIASDHLRGLVEEAYQFAGHLVNGDPPPRSRQLPPLRQP